ncbi:MAG: UDP-N-acetylmuramate--L-alanine ligase [Candidatus Levybacteria bacterium]|nr:UDP-N-acetylmuramate--L-alanine ligase [Candidatus Levybacteria bacterium]MBI4098263.1 UDP-N-acetylmuramate--L-alanine ligase [Candidatus Levybacteria bacterium]
MKKKRIHFVGVKGVGMAPLAIIAKEAGFEVSGCDVEEKFITDVPLNKAGISPQVGFTPEHIESVDMVIATGAHGGFDNIEVKSAKEKNLKVLTHGEALGLFQSGDFFGKQFYGISVAGSHGKTTTSAIFATVLTANKMDPSFAIGTGNIPSLGSCGHFGKDKYFIAEADEYVNDSVYDKTPKFLFQNPKMIIVTNIDFDHPDVFKNIDHIREVFLKFANKLSPDGLLVVCGDGEENRKFIKAFDRRKVTYGFSEVNDYVIKRVSISSSRMFFWVKRDGITLGEFSIQVFGEQNALDATAVIAGSLEIGLSIDQIKKGLTHFVGSKRRSEFIGNLPSGALLYDDYAHHPEEIKKTLNAFRKNFPKERITCIFQPHMYSRTKTLLSEFAKSFDDCDQVIITEIFPSFREEIDPNFSARFLSDEVNNRNGKSIFIPRLSDVIEYLDRNPGNKHSVLITMGAGDVYKIGEELLKH